MHYLAGIKTHKESVWLEGLLAAAPCMLWTALDRLEERRECAWPECVTSFWLHWCIVHSLQINMELSKQVLTLPTSLAMIISGDLLYCW